MQIALIGLGKMGYNLALNLRNNGDDAMAMWSKGTANVNNTFRFNTAQMPILANTYAIYGGDGNDPCMNGSDGASGDYLNGGPGKDGYNVDAGDTVARQPNDYWVDGEFCGGWDGHGPV